MASPERAHAHVPHEVHDAPPAEPAALAAPAAPTPETATLPAAAPAVEAVPAVPEQPKPANDNPTDLNAERRKREADKAAKKAAKEQARIENTKKRLNTRSESWADQTWVRKGDGEAIPSTVFKVGAIAAGSIAAGEYAAGMVAAAANTGTGSIGILPTIAKTVAPWILAVSPLFVFFGMSGIVNWAAKWAGAKSAPASKPAAGGGGGGHDHH